MGLFESSISSSCCDGTRLAGPAPCPYATDDERVLGEWALTSHWSAPALDGLSAYEVGVEVVVVRG